MKPTLPRAEIRTDLEAIAVPGTNGHGPTDDLAREILEERRNRLRKQNKKLDFELELKEQQYGDLAAIRRDVLRCNAVVKQSLFAMAVEIAGELARMDDPDLIRQFLHQHLTEAFNDLAYEHGGTSEE